MLGLVLTAGGARGAYQSGVLQRLSEQPALRNRPSPFAIIAGASAGAINGALLAAASADFGEAAALSARLWSNLQFEQVIRTDAGALAWRAATLARDFALGGLLGSTITHGLFDTSPLASLISEAFPPRGIAAAIRRGDLYAVAVSATSYHSGRSYTFIQGRPGHPIWTKRRRVVLPVTLTDRHVLASSAIPIVFPPVQIASAGSDLWFGDGGLRLVAPMSPAIRLGSTHLVAIGVRSTRAADSLASDESGGAAAALGLAPRLLAPPLAQVCGVFMNAIFLDHLDADLDHLQRMNELVAANAVASSAATGPRSQPTMEPMRPIASLVVSPSEDLALVAQRFAHRMPRVLRYVLDGLGTPDAQSADLTSYLLFDSAFTRTLVEIGYRDADARAAEIEALIADSGALSRPARATRRTTSSAGLDASGTGRSIARA
jgi:NTE family protein